MIFRKIKLPRLGSQEMSMFTIQRIFLSKKFLDQMKLPA